jgi:hypothetical protein
MMRSGIESGALDEQLMLRRIPLRRLGTPGDVADVVEFIRRAGVEDPDLDDPGLVGWRGGDRTVWTVED